MWIHSQCSIQPSKGHWWRPPFYFSGFVHWLKKKTCNFCTCKQSCYRNNPFSTSDNKHKLHPESKKSGSEFSCWFWLPRGWCYFEVQSQWSFPKAKSVVVCLQKEGQDFAAVVLMTWELSLKILNLWCCSYVLSWGAAGITEGKQLHTQE